MGRRIMFNRAADPTQVLSALDGGGNAAEAGIEAGAPIAASGNKGKMILNAGGSVATAETYVAGIARSGNLGNAEWAFNYDADSYLNGACAPWIPDNLVNIVCYDPINVPHRLKRVDHPVDGRKAFLWFVNDTVLKFMRYNHSTESWLVTPQTVATGVTSGASADGLMFPDTGEMVVFCDGTLYSQGGDDYEVGASYFAKGEATDWNTSSIQVTMVWARNRLVVLYCRSQKIYSIVSYDRGVTWDVEVAVSDDFADAINQADSIHATVSPADGAIYMVVEDDTDGTGNADDMVFYRSSDGLEWERTTAMGLSQTLEHASIMALEDGTIVNFYQLDDNKIYAWWHNIGASAVRVRSGDRAYSGAVIGGLGATPYTEGVFAVDMGDKVLGVMRFGGTGSAQDCLISLRLRGWSNISEEQGYNQICWTNTQFYGPDNGWGWNPNGAGTETLSLARMRLQTTDANSQRSYYYNKGNPSGATQPSKIKWRAKCGDYCDHANRRVGLRCRYRSAASKGFDFGVYFDDNEIRIYDYGAAAWLGAAAETVDLTDEVEFYLEIEFDEAAGGADLTLYYRVTTGGNGYPHDYWTPLIEVTTSQDLPYGDNQWAVEFGNFSNVAGQTTESSWYFFLTAITGEEANTTDYKNTDADFSSLSGKLCSHLAQEMVRNEMSLWFRGAGAYKDDYWIIPTRYLWEKENVYRVGTKRQWRSDADEQEVKIAFYEDDNRPFRPDWVALFGINFDDFYLEADDAVTFDSDGGNPEYSMHVHWGTNPNDDAVSHVCNYLAIQNVARDMLRIVDGQAQLAAMWKGRFDKDNILGKRWFMRIIGGGHANEVYLIESIEMIGLEWWIKLAPDADGGYPDLTSGTAVTTSDHIGIFGDAIAIELPNSTFMRHSGYKYFRIRIVSQTTWDGDYRIGFAMLSMSAAFGVQASLSSATDQRLTEPEWGGSLGVPPNVASIVSPSGAVSKRRKGRALREVSLSWSGQAGRDAWQNQIRSVLEACHSDTPVVYLDMDDFVHTGKETPSGTASRVCYDPILCYLEGVLQIKQDAYSLFTPQWGTANLQGMIASIGGITLKEIV